MKKLILIAAVAICTQFATAQVGITGGYLNVKTENAGEGNSGFYAGFYTDIDITESFHLQPSLLYGNSCDTNFIYVPLMFKYYVANTDLNIQAGPQGTVILEDLGDFKNQLGLDLAVGVGFDIFYNIFVEARYAFKLVNEDIARIGSTNFNTLHIGLGIAL
ncbi:outer membrane beta-barrel protein [Mesonia ostreae]|uniref:Outer membrane beta-barrel protein n=1 Tax=Mesonia ostreae TaxID=861110 RepID=A0ABU2KGK9_9FLAO|nr:outer membrane beta-barrel protein [Mesonia ostreae]MDT0293846.1 outer membrane beta-barrel protein [Mesonia ostreae]